jgi:hypothetical protein
MTCLSGNANTPVPGPWTPLRASSLASEEAAIRHMDWDEAQTWCNFVLMRPSNLPKGLKVQGATMRPEAPPGRAPGLDLCGRFGHGISNRASHLCHVAGLGRALQIKQFFYDLGPPAFDHPSMWRNHADPFTVGTDVGWLGIDFRGLIAASVQVDRTMVELAVTEGQFSPLEIKTICRALCPVSSNARRSILATPIAELCYQRRYPDLVITVPIGHWYHRRRPPSLLTSVLPAAEVSGRLLPAHTFAPAGFRLDTVFLLGSPDEPQELELVYEHLDYPGHTLRILIWPPSTPNPLSFPPTKDPHPGYTTSYRLHGRQVFHAFSSRRFGQHEVVWKQGDMKLMVMLKPAPWTDFRSVVHWLRDFLDPLEQSSPT